MLRPAIARPGHKPSGRHRRGTAVLTAVVTAALAVGWAVPAAADDLPEQTPGVTLRTYQLPGDPGAVCELRSGTTPNVDKVMPTIDWRTSDEFGLSDHFLTHVHANLTVETAGLYELRMTNDDGALLYLDGELLLENDGPQDSTSVTGSVELDAGVHELRIDHYEGTNNQRLTLEWKAPGQSGFQVVPTSALSTDANVVRVTAPGVKFCEGVADTPGDGLRLYDVNPNYELVDLRPEGFEPNVSGLDFTEDGDLVVATAGAVSSGGWVEDPYSGELYILEGAQQADGPEDVTARLIAEDLFNPMGVAVIGDSIFISERDGLTELVPETDPEDPDAPMYVRSPEYEDGKFATWPDGGNFHEFAFGLVHDDDYFYLSLSVAINAGGASTDPQPAEGRGTTIRVDRESGEIDFVAGGLRTPNGIGWGGTDGDDLFVMDNQGDWLPSSKLVHIKQGRFFNHYTNPAGPFDDQPVTQPVVWVPQNEIGNSPTTPVQIQDGIFEGQMLFGDVTYGGLQRAFLEEVEGEYQGVVFRHSAGIEAGVNRTIIGPDGSIYVGGIGEGGNWGEAGKLRYGLQKLVPNDTNVFDMNEVRLADGGFDITYTQPISEETLETIDEAYRVTQWRYVPTSNYGGPKVGQEALPVTDVEVSEDRMTVSLEIDGLKPGHVVHLHSPRPFEADGGQELWNTEAWYTLNALPGYEAPADRGWYEAEEAALLGSAGIQDEHVGYSGTGFADGIQNVGAGVRFTVQAPEAGVHPVQLRYANGPNPAPGTKDLSLYVNDEKIGPWALPSTGTWKDWGTVTRDLELDEGTNTITVRYDEGDDGNVNLDVLSVGITDICTPVEVEDGYTSLFDGTLASFDEWSWAGQGSFGRYDDCTLRTAGGMGLLWHPDELENGYSLKLDWKLVKDDNGGVFVGFPDPGNDPWIAVDHGYEIQIDATDEDDRTTGAIYTFQGADLEARDAALNPVGQWNAYEIVVEGDNIRIYLNDVLVNDFISTDPDRDLSSGHIGLQNHGGGETVHYTNVRVADLDDLEQPEPEPVLVPVEKVSLGLFSLIPWVGQDGLPEVLNRLASIGFENVEPFGSNFNGYDAESFRALTDSLGLNVLSSHYNVGEAGFDATLDFVETLGQQYVGSGGFAAPGIGSYENTLATAETMNRLGERSVEAGIGKFFGHNHAGEFTTTYEHNGEDMSAWEILVAETNPDYVTFQVDVAWAAHGGVDVVELLEEYGDRIELLHIKDATNVGGSGSPTFAKLGEGEVPLQDILRAAEEHADIALYVMEYDVSPVGQEFAAEGFEYLTGVPAGEATEFSPVAATPAAVTFDDEAGTYTVPTTTGVQYYVGDEVIAAGTHEAEGTVTVSARPRNGFAIADGATAEWSFTFTAPEPEPVLVPVEKVSLGLFSLIPWVGQDGLPEVLNRLASIGFVNVEPFGSNFNGYDAESFRALTDSLGLNVLSSHYNVGEAGFDATLDFVEVLGQEYVGSGGFAAPGINTYENTLATAETMNRLGERSVEAGIGKFFGHNHDSEFTTTYEHNGEVMSAWEILVAETNPDYVTFQVDVAWAAHAGVDVVELLEEYGDRIELLHVKDATGLGEGRPTFAKLGEGDVPLQAILAAAQEHADIALYVMEYDVSPVGQEFAAEGFEYLTGVPAGEATEFSPVEATPAAVTFDDEAGTYTVPTTTGVQYYVGDQVIAAGTHEAEGTVTVTAQPRNGFAIADDATTEWSFTFTAPQPEPVEVTPGAVTFDDQDGTEDDNYTVPSVEGVEYLVADQVVEAGTHPGAGTVTVTARALDGYVLADGATAEWSHTFSTEGGEPTPQPSTGAEFHLSNDWVGTTHHFFKYGRITDEVFVGDWDGNGTDTIALRRGNTFYVSNAPRGGEADWVFRYGREGDVVLVGDWDGDGRDSFAVRRGSEYHVKNELLGGAADVVFHYGRGDDVVLVGDWDGNGRDTLAVRREATYHVRNTLSGGAADAVFTYGRGGDVVLVGDWDGDGYDTLAVRRGAQYHVRNTLSGGPADVAVYFGRANDEVFVGDWDGNGTDTLGIRRGQRPAQQPARFADAVR